LSYFKTPLLFAEGGEKEEKSRGKNEKAMIIISHLKEPINTKTNKIPRKMAFLQLFLQSEKSCFRLVLSCILQE
jgi:hypothetical protein